MLSQAEHKYLHICSQNQAHPELTLDALGEQLGIPKRTVERALAWGKRLGIVQRLAADQLREHIAEHRKHLTWLEKERKLYVKSLVITKTVVDPDTGAETQRRTRKPADPYKLKAFTSSISEVRTKLMELEGIYRATVQLDLHARPELDAIDLSGLPDEDLATLAEIIDRARSESPE